MTETSIDMLDSTEAEPRTNILCFEMQPSIMDQTKLEYLNKGYFTDCSFLVGFDHSDQEIFHGVQETMVKYSPFFSAMLGNQLNPPTVPVRIDFLRPETFKLIMEFLHLGGHFVTPVELKEAVDLVIAAEYCYIASLKNTCIEMIKEKVDESTIWASLNQLLEANL